MKPLIEFSLMMLMAGCSSPKQTVGPAAEPREPSFLNPVPTHVVEQAKRRISTLREGMTREQVYAALGLVPYQRRILCRGGGSSGNSWLDCRLRQGCGLLLRLGERGEVRSASIEDANWPDRRKEEK